MATNAIVYSTSYETITIQDYTGTPNSIAVNIIKGSLNYPSVDPIDHTVVMINSSSGATRHAAPVHGKRGGVTFSFQMVLSDVANNTDKNAYSLVKALQLNSVAGTGHSGEDYSSQLTGGGKKQAKIVVAAPNQSGTSATLTFPSIVTDVVPDEAEGIRTATVTLELVGSVTAA